MEEPNVLKNFIDGVWVESQTDHYKEVPNPATEELLALVPISTKEDLNSAIISAKMAFSKWSKVPYLSALVYYLITNNY